MIDILMADDHTIFRRGIRRLLSDETDMRVVAEASNGQEAIEYLNSQNFDLVLLDINMGGRGGLDTLQRIRREWKKLPVVILTMYPQEQYAPVALKLGANGFLSKDRDAPELINAIRVVAAGGYYVPMDSREHIGRTGASSILPLHDSLTPREWEVLRLITKGETLTGIGQRLNLSVKTIGTYRSRLLNKLKVTSNAGLVRYCLTNDIGDQSLY